MNLHNEIMNITEKRPDSSFESTHDRLLYKEGHRDARHAAAELSLQAPDIDDIYRQHAAERLRADTMEQRWQAKTKECNDLREMIAKLNEKLEGVK